MLLRGLSPHSATVTKISSSRYLGRERGPVNEVRGAKAAQQAFVSLFSPGKPRA